MNTLRTLNAYCLWVAGAAILVMTLLGGADVISTALLHQPIPGVYEATEALMVLVIFLSLGYLQLGNGNIAVDILTSHLRGTARVVQVAAAEILAVVFFSLLAWQAWVMAVESWSIDEYSAGLVRFPLYPAKFALALGAALTVCCCLVRLIYIRELAHQRSEIDAHAD